MKAQIATAALFLLTACTANQSASGSGPAQAPDATMNPLLEPTWHTPFGAPPFDRVADAHFAPALEEGMKQHAAELEAIATDEEEPTFANTIEALERAGALLERVELVFDNLANANTNDQLQAIKAEYAPKLSKHFDKLFLDERIFARIDALATRVSVLDLSREQSKLLLDYHREFLRKGARLGPEHKARLSEINARLAELYTIFGDNVRRENADYALVIENEKDLAGLPAEVIAAAADAATDRGHEGKWAFTLVRSSVNPFLEHAENRELRREIYDAYISRGANGDDKDTRALIKEIAALRAEKAALLGASTWAHHSTGKNMAGTPEAVRELLEKLWHGALPKAKRERAALTEMLKKDLGADAKLEPWDWRYYAEKVRKARYDLSQDELKPYFQVDAVRDGAFGTATRLWGITFTEVTDEVPRYTEDVKAFEVREADGAHVGLLYVDYHPRPGKRGGAWMNYYRRQSNLDGRVRPIVVNVGNFPPPAAGKPALLGWDEVETLFHEFGHALHGLLSDVTYEKLAGTKVKRDYVEMPSQILENWAAVPSVIKEYARHYETGDPIPDALVEKIDKASTFNQGFAMTELVAAALLDLEWHSLSVDEALALQDVRGFDRAAMAKIGLIPEIAPRYHAPYFQHIFAGDSYSAGYYVYMWAKVLEADAFRAFEEKGDPFDRELASRLREFVFSAGASDEEMDLYVKFRGQEPSVQPLLEKTGMVE